MTKEDMDFDILIETLKVELIKALSNVCCCSVTGDVNRNHTNYGVATQCANTLRLLGQEVKIACWEDDGYLLIENLIINGKDINF